MTERDDFDKIVEGLDLDLSFIDDVEVEQPAEPIAPVWTTSSDEVDDDRTEVEEEPFYRQVEPRPLIPRQRSLLLAWVGVFGAPLTLVLATLSNIYLGRSVVAGAALIFVAAAIYLILQLPEHGPSRRDWPDDGAVL